jgi:hypothetical protein
MSDVYQDESNKSSGSSSKSSIQTPKVSNFIDLNSTNMKKFLRSQKFLKEDEKLVNTKFNRLQFRNPYNAISGTREYVFFTKFDLHITNPGTETKTLNSELGNDPYWLDANLRYKDIIKQLQLSSTSDTMPFMPILTNSIDSTLDLPAITADVTETPQTIYGTSLQYRGSSRRSDEGFDFSLEFRDNPWLSVYQLFKMYDEYEREKTLGRVTPPKYDNTNSKSLNRYTVDRILHDQNAIYKFILEDDMETIIYYAYLCGCFPKSVPRDTFREIEDGLIKYSVDWHAQFVDDMKPIYLSNFNQICRSYINPNTNTMIPT